MAVMDLYRSLTDEQQARLRACQSLAEMQTVIKEEGIVLTEEHMEAICGYGWNGLGRKKKRSYLIETGLFGRFIVPSEEWKDLLQEAEEHESVIRRRFPFSSQQEAAACKLIIGENSALRNALLTADDTRSFLDSCLTLRCSFQDGKLRRLAREQARLLGYLADGAPLPDSAEAVLSLWETANRMEPRWADDLPAHFRTPDERVPFAHGKNPFVSAPVPVGYETSPPEEIPEAVSRLAEFVQRQDLPRELAAFTAHFLLVWIHPFPDGNGHTARLLCCGMLAPKYSAATLTAFLSLMHENKRAVHDAAIVAGLSDGNMCPQCCTLIRLLIRGQKRLLSSEL